MKALFFKDEKQSLQRSIDSGEIETAKELQTWIWRRGWNIRLTERLSGQQHRILIVKPGVGRGFQIEAPFDVCSFEFRQPGIWIYALLARSDTQKACYIGQTASVMRRMAEHAKRSRQGRGSDAFFHWSDEHEAKVHVILLELSRSASTKSITAQRATVLEGLWLKAAEEAAYQTPNSEQWGRLPHPQDQTRSFCENKIWHMAKPFDDVVQRSPPLKNFWLGPV